MSKIRTFYKIIVKIQNVIYVWYLTAKFGKIQYWLTKITENPHELTSRFHPGSLTLHQGSLTQACWMSFDDGEPQASWDR